MRRRLFNAAALVSLVLYVGVLAAFARSLWWSDDFQLNTVEDRGRLHYRWYYCLLSGRGGLELACDAEIVERVYVMPGEGSLYGDPWRWQTFHARPARYPRPAFNTRERAKLGFWLKWTSNPATVCREIIVPYWFLAVLTGVLPSIWLVRRRRESVRRRRAAAGLCIGCGYDLRASTDCCSECGQAVAR
jgi:hypothetical protein